MAKDKGLERVVVYLGDDNGYWQTVMTRLAETYQTIKFKFIALHDPDPVVYQLLFVQLVRAKPEIIYLDLSQDSEYQMRFGRLIKNEITIKDVPLVGLIDERELIPKCQSIGVDFIHIKGGEYYDVVYDPYAMAFPGQVKRPNFAVAKFIKEVEFLESIRVIYIAATYIHAEGNLELSAGDVVTLSTGISKKLVPSNNYMVKKVHSSDLTTNSKYAYDLEFVFVDRPEITEGEDEEESSKAAQFLYKEKMNEYSNLLRITKKKCQAWVLDNLDISAKNKLKILIMDRELMACSSDEVMEARRQEYNIMCQTESSEELEEVEVFKPSLIVVQFPKPPVMEKKGPKAEEEFNEIVAQNERDTLDQITEILKKIKSMDNYNPFLVIFNSQKYSSKSFQDSFKYSFILANQTMLNLSYILELAEMYKKKQDSKKEAIIKRKILKLKKEDPMKYGRLSPSDFEEKRYYIRDAHELSRALSSHLIELQTMTESELTFLSDIELGESVYRMDFPVDMAVTLVRDEAGSLYISESGRRLYKGMIHSVDELDKKKIRQFVNEIFFTTLNDQRKKEKDEFERLNKDIMVERGLVEEGDDKDKEETENETENETKGAT